MFFLKNVSDIWEMCCIADVSPTTSTPHYGGVGRNTRLDGYTISGLFILWIYMVPIEMTIPFAHVLRILKPYTNRAHRSSDVVREVSSVCHFAKRPGYSDMQDTIYFI